jgi:serine protease AprX
MVMPDGSLVASSYASSFTSKLFPGRNVPDVCGVVGEASPAPMKGHIILPVPANSELDGENFSPKRKGTGWGIFSGTSAASPQIAGVVALMKSINKNLRPDKIRSILASSAVDVTSGKTAMGDRAVAGADLATGAGFVDAYKACKSAGAIV